jgi:hypothetical protein
MLQVELDYTTLYAAYVWVEFSAGRPIFLALVGPSVLSPLVDWAIERVGSRESAVFGYLSSAVALSSLPVADRNGFACLGQRFRGLLPEIASLRGS